jgi:menaquinone-dependent protoporphyrinogen oxidase
MKMAAARGERPPRRHLKGRLALKALVTVASRHGATSDIGEAIASRLRQHGHEASTAPPDEVAEVGPYDAVILGSAVYMGRWLPAAVDFADRHLVALRDRSVWLFSSGPLGDPPVPAGDAADVPSLVERVGAREHRTFAGELQEGALGFKERLIVRMVKAPYGDFRDWNAIDAWADTIAEAASRIPVPA